jgi:hypothetical protein
VDEADEEEKVLQNSCVHLQTTSAGVDSHELLGLPDQSARTYSYDDSAEGSSPHLQKLRRDDDLYVGAEYVEVEEEEEARNRARACATTPGELRLLVGDEYEEVEDEDSPPHLANLAGGMYEEEEEEEEPPPPYEAAVCTPLSFFLEEHGLLQYLEIMR